ncbi:MAG: HupE/UreJ family protein [Sandaracinaceae bacterium]|nr:HupE/UreJ family protein [Myxococcales bacterium]MCB9657667.1 HupE/UreJ family protein [Sandaracinaceae bacterium]
MRACLAASAMLPLVLGAAAAYAHPLAPAALILRELPGAPAGTLEVTWRTSRVRPRGEQLSPRLPERCVPDPESERELPQENVVARTWRTRCGEGPLAGLANQTVSIDGLERTETNVFVEVQLRDGRTVSALLHAQSPSLQITEEVSEAHATANPGFVTLGVGHLLSGADHVLFVLGLVLLVSRLRDLLWLVSAFTVGHSVSLALSATGVLQLPSAPVEVVIALSLLWLALRVLARRAALDAAPPSVRRAAFVCAAFGLLHGLGFASAFAESGATGRSLPAALLGFNVGVELGQLAIVVPAALALALLRRHDDRHHREARVMFVGAYAIGCVSAYFVLERTPSLLAALQGLAT